MKKPNGLTKHSRKITGFPSWQKHYIRSAETDPSGPFGFTQANSGGSELRKLNRGNHERACSAEWKILGTVTSQLPVGNLSRVWINQETHEDARAGIARSCLYY